MRLPWEGAGDEHGPPAETFRKPPGWDLKGCHHSGVDAAQRGERPEAEREPLRANDDETSSPRKFSLEGAEG